MDELLKRLCDAASVSGNENEVRAIVKEEAEKYADDVKVDKLGNVIAFKKGISNGKRIMLVAHMDEVGLIVSKIEDNGYIKFKPVGAVDARSLLSKRVFIGKNKIPGVLGIKAIHLQTPEERKKPVPMASMYIDVGATSKEETGIRLGDYISFATKAEEFGDNKVKAKALDNRFAVRLLLELLKKTFENDAYFCFTVQEEIGQRGAGVAAFSVEPDEAIVVDAVRANDIPNVDENEMISELGKGPVISFADYGTLSERKLTAKLIQIAEQNDILYQRRRDFAGKNDAANIHITKSGIPTSVVSLPVRYLHSPCSVADTRDYDKTMALIEAYINIL